MSAQKLRGQQSRRSREPQPCSNSEGSMCPAVGDDQTIQHKRGHTVPSARSCRWRAHAGACDDPSQGGSVLSSQKIDQMRSERSTKTCVVETGLDQADVSKTRLDHVQCRCDIAYRAGLQGQLPDRNIAPKHGNISLRFEVDGAVDPSRLEVSTQHPRVAVHQRGSHLHVIALSAWFILVRTRRLWEGFRSSVSHISDNSVRHRTTTACKI